MTESNKKVFAKIKKKSIRRFRALVNHQEIKYFDIKLSKVSDRLLDIKGLSMSY